MIDVWQGEASNNERIKKTPEKQLSKLRAGYYPSNPHTGYKLSDVPGLHVPDYPNWTAMQQTMKEIANGECDISEGLKRVTSRGLRTKNYGPRGVGGRPVDMFRWKKLLVDPYYAGIISLTGWGVEGEVIGLHDAMITEDEHKILIRLVAQKGKKFNITQFNPDFILNNNVECAECLRLGKRECRIVGYYQRKGKKEVSPYAYKRYRCRECNLGVRQEDIHEQLRGEFDKLILSERQIEKLKAHLTRIWKSYEKENIERVIIAQGRLRNLQTDKSDLITLMAKSPRLQSDIAAEVDRVNELIKTADMELKNTMDYEKDLGEFIEFSLRYLENLKTEFWELKNKQDVRIYKQLFFPAGIQITQDRKVYIPEISPVYLYENEKQPPVEADFTKLERFFEFARTHFSTKV